MVIRVWGLRDLGFRVQGSGFRPVRSRSCHYSWFGRAHQYHDYPSYPRCGFAALSEDFLPLFLLLRASFLSSDDGDDDYNRDDEIDGNEDGEDDEGCDDAGDDDEYG